MRQRAPKALKMKDRPDQALMRRIYGAPRALGRVRESLEQGACWIVEMDLTELFGSDSHELLVDTLAERVADDRVLDLIRGFLTAGALRHGELELTAVGVSRDGITNPMLANIYLQRFDEKMLEAGFALIRHAEDAVIACRFRSEAERASKKARAVLERDLGLELSPEKVRIVHITQGFRFMGLYIQKEGHVSRRPVRPLGALHGGGLAS